MDSISQSRGEPEDDRSNQMRTQSEDHRDHVEWVESEIRNRQETNEDRQRNPVIPFHVFDNIDQLELDAYEDRMLAAQRHRIMQEVQRRRMELDDRRQLRAIAEEQLREAREQHRLAQQRIMDSERQIALAIMQENEGRHQFQQADELANGGPQVEAQSAQQARALQQAWNHQVRRLNFDENREVQLPVDNVPAANAMANNIQRPDVVIPAMANRRRRARALPGGSNMTWMFTSWDEWNPNPERMDGQVDYVSAQQEVSQFADRSLGQGGVHWQGYAEFPRRVTARDALSILGLGDNVHIEPRGNRTQQDAIEYTQKAATSTGVRFIFGQPHGGNAVTSMQAAAKMAASGVPMDQIAAKHPVEVARHASNLQKLVMLSTSPPEERDVNVQVFWGVTGSGKTTLARIEANELGIDLFDVGMTGAFPFEGYNGEKGILFDEFTGQIPIGEMCKLLGKFRHRVQVKGSSQWYMATNIWICSNKPMEEWYPRASPMEKAALMRRINNIVYFDRPFEDVDNEIPDPFA